MITTDNNFGIYRLINNQWLPARFMGSFITTLVITHPLYITSIVYLAPSSIINYRTGQPLITTIISSPCLSAILHLAQIQQLITQRLYVWLAVESLLLYFFYGVL